MHTISHIFSGFLILRIFMEINPDIYSKSAIFIILSVVFSNLPDIDILWSKTLNEHHNSPLHAPLFWIIISATMLIILPRLAFLTFLMITNVLFHLFSDYLTGRTAGIPLLFPFSKKEYSLKRLNKSKGNFHPINLKEYVKFNKYYLKDKLLVAIEGVVLVLGIISVFV